MKNQVSRRQFVKHTTTGAALGASALIVQTARGQSANERIRIGVIGCGGRGSSHLRSLAERQRTKRDVQVIAVCDVYDARKQRAREISGGEVYHDYHEMLDRPDLDAVVIATPDHWHGQQALDALDKGKDVYLEKPMTHTLEEAKAVHKKVLETGRVLQVGSQYCSQDQWWLAKDAIEQGAIGHLIWAQGTYCRNSMEGEWNYYEIDPNAGPNNIDWNLWQGPARRYPWNPDRYFRFRKYWDYSGGIATDLLYHKLAPMLIPLGKEFPFRVVGTGGIWVQKDERDVPDTFFFNADFHGDFSMTMPSSMANSVGVADIIRGHYGTIYLHDDHIQIVPDPPFVPLFKKKYGKNEVVMQTRPRADHMSNFLDCVRKREKPTLDSELGYKTQVAISMSVESYRQGKTLFFDSASESVTFSAPRRFS